MKKIIFLIAALVVALISLSSANAQTYPTKPITIVVGFGPGGNADIVARIVSQKMAENLGQSILIENGHTDFGRALIELSALLGASKIFATGPIECHPLLDELGAVPLGAKTFSWELFLEANIGLVLVQEMPTEGACLAVLHHASI